MYNIFFEFFSDVDKKGLWFKCIKGYIKKEWLYTRKKSKISRRGRKGERQNGSFVEKTEEGEGVRKKGKRNEMERDKVET